MCLLLRTAHSVVTLAVVLLLTGPAQAQQPAGTLAAWFQQNAAWSATQAVTPSADGTQLQATPGGTGGTLVITDAKPGTRHLKTKAYLSDCFVSMEYLLTSDAKAGIFLSSAYRIQLDGAAAGALGVMVAPDRKPGAVPTVPPLQAGAGQSDVWHKLEARVRTPRYNEASQKSENALILEVKIDGVVVQRNTVATGWCLGTESEWETTGGHTSIDVDAGGMAIRAFSLQRADYEAIVVPKTSGGATNAGELIDYVQQGSELFRALGCIECHALQPGEISQKTGPNLFGLFRVEPRDRLIVAGEGHRFTIKADRAYLHRSLRTPAEELAVAENGPTQGTPYLPAMPPYFPAVVTDQQVDAIGTYLATLNEPEHQGPVIKLVRQTGLENYDPMTDRLQLLMDRPGMTPASPEIAWERVRDKL